MESYKSWLASAVRNGITLEQMMFLYLIKLKDFLDPKSWSNQYVTKVQTFSVEGVIHPLVERGWLINLNQPGEYYPELMMASEEGDGLFATYMMGEELWNSYPSTFPIGQGGMFIARAGIERDDLIEEYLKKIDHDPIIHVRVLKRLKLYEQMVHNGQINGHKIVNFVKEMLWEAIPDKEEGPKFGKEI